MVATIPPPIAAARLRAAAARQALARDLTVVKDRASPSALAGDARIAVVQRLGSHAPLYAGLAALAGLALLLPPVRRVACAGWRNRDAIGRFMTRNDG